MVKRGQFNHQLLFTKPGLTNEMITEANTSARRWGGGHCCDQRGLTPNCKNANSGTDLRDDDRCNFVGDNGLGLVIVDVDCLKRAHAKRLLAVGHPVAMDTLKRRCYGNRRWCGTGSCTHAPQAAVNDIASNLETGSTNTHTPTKKAAYSGNMYSYYCTCILCWYIFEQLNNINHFKPTKLSDNLTFPLNTT